MATSLAPIIVMLVSSDVVSLQFPYLVYRAFCAFTVNIALSLTNCENLEHDPIMIRTLISGLVVMYNILFGPIIGSSRTTPIEYTIRTLSSSYRLLRVTVIHYQANQTCNTIVLAALSLRPQEHHQDSEVHSI
jgi:hypothetical protein